MNYGAAIRAIAAARKMTIREVAVRAAMTEGNLGRIANGRHTPTCLSLHDIAAALRIPAFLIVLLASEDQDLRWLQDDDAGRRLAGALKLGAELGVIFEYASNYIRGLRAAPAAVPQEGPPPCP